MISTLMSGLAASNSSTSWVTAGWVLVSQLASLMVTCSPVAASSEVAPEAVESAAAEDEAVLPQPASRVPVMARASSKDVAFFMVCLLFLFKNQGGLRRLSLPLL